MFKEGVAEDKVIPALHQQLAKTTNFFVGFKVSIDRSYAQKRGIKTPK